jgi:hypothetical protein
MTMMIAASCRVMTRRCTIADVHAVADALGEPLAIQSQTWRPAPLMLVKNSTDTRWFRSLAATATAWCLLRGRVNYPLQGAVLLYFGGQADEFRRLCSPFGVVRRPWGEGAR